MYARLLDKQYASERPLPLDRKVLYAMVRAHSKADREAVESVLRQFFKKGRHGFANKRAKNELVRMHKISTIRSSAGKQKGKRSANAANLLPKPEARSHTPDTQDHLSVDIAAEEANSATTAAFTALGYDQPFGPQEFRASWTREYATVTNGDFTDAMERTAKFCQSQKVSVPKLFFTLKRKVEEMEIENRFRKRPL